MSLTPEPAYHTLVVLGSLYPTAAMSLLSSQSIMAYDGRMFLYFVRNLNPGLTLFTSPWVPWSLNEIQDSPIKPSQLGSSQAAGLMPLMVPNCYSMRSRPPLFSAVLTWAGYEANHVSPV